MVKWGKLKVQDHLHVIDCSVPAADLLVSPGNEQAVPDDDAENAGPANAAPLLAHHRHQRQVQRPHLSMTALWLSDQDVIS